MIIMASTLITAINEVRHVTPEELTRDTIKSCKDPEGETMKTFDNCTVYHTGISKPHTLLIENRLISIVYYPVEYTDNPVLYAECTDTKGNKYKVYSYDHGTWTGWLAFPNEPNKISGILP